MRQPLLRPTQEGIKTVIIGTQMRVKAALIILWSALKGRLSVIFQEPREILLRRILC